MPVRPMNSAVFRWPDREQALAAARAWARSIAARDAGVLCIGCVGSAARGDWGVGSDLDLVVIVRDAPADPVERLRRYEPADLPVPADVFVYTQQEWARLMRDRPLLRRRWDDEWITLSGRRPAEPAR